MRHTQYTFVLVSFFVFFLLIRFSVFHFKCSISSYFASFFFFHSCYISWLWLVFICRFTCFSTSTSSSYFSLIWSDSLLPRLNLICLLIYLFIYFHRNRNMFRYELIFMCTACVVYSRNKKIFFIVLPRLFDGFLISFFFCFVTILFYFPLFSLFCRQRCKTIRTRNHYQHQQNKNYFMSIFIYFLFFSSKSNKILKKRSTKDRNMKSTQ